MWSCRKEEANAAKESCEVFQSLLSGESEVVDHWEKVNIEDNLLTSGQITDEGIVLLFKNIRQRLKRS